MSRPLSFHDTARQSPFRRQNSASPATANGRVTTPSASPTKQSTFSPSKPGALSPEKASPFTRRPSQISQASSRPSSPFARPSSSLSVPQSPSRQASGSSNISANEEDAPPSSPGPPSSPTRRVSRPTAEEERGFSSPAIARDVTDPPMLDGPSDSPSIPPPSQAALRPSAPRTVTSSTISTVKPPLFSPNHPKSSPAVPRLNNTFSSAAGSYTHIPQPLLRSMRESFEVLDSDNSGTITSASVANMLEQMGMNNTPSALRDFFPQNGPAQLNLARYLDMLAAPLQELSQPDELQAAFEAFDVDDSGQIDLAELRHAVLNTVPEPREDPMPLSEREVDGTLGEFASRRAFGAKGLNVAKGRGEVFRYRDFMASISGGAEDAAAGMEAAAVGA